MEDSTTRIYTRWKILLRVMKEAVVPDKAGSFEGWLKERKKDGDGGETGGENSGWENRWWKTGLLNLGANCSSHSQCELKGDLVSGGPGRIEPLGEDAV
jgi:hypothetical protein